MEYSPELPLDVVRLFMEAAAWSDRSTAHSLTLVSKDVRQWTDHILYHNVFLDTPTKVSAFAASVVARDPDFLRRTVKSLTIGGLDSEEFPQEDAELDKSIIIVVKACTSIERFSYWSPIQLNIFRPLSKYLRPSHISIMLGNGCPLSPSLFSMTSSILTHLHLGFQSFHQLSSFHSIWTRMLKEAPRLAHLHLSGVAFEGPLDALYFDLAIIPIVSVLPQTLTSLIVSAITLRTHTAGGRIPVQVKRHHFDPRVVYVLPTPDAHIAGEELQSHEKYRDSLRPAYLNWRSREDSLWGVFEKIS
ncbi:hypothetical protein CPB85DRAFT_1437418 [Mucidula mucida]|nr:hypothetical protein CPB85DRAFT_1437418 [Mucidula mucida]